MAIPKAQSILTGLFEGLYRSGNKTPLLRMVGGTLGSAFAAAPLDLHPGSEHTSASGGELLVFQ